MAKCDKTLIYQGFGIALYEIGNPTAWLKFKRLIRV